MTLTDQDWGYLAGLLHGEGCFKVYWRDGRLPELSVTVEMTDIEAIQAVARRFGGNLEPPRERHHIQGYSQRVTWCALPEVIELVRRVQPLIPGIKGRQVRLFLALAESLQLSRLRMQNRGRWAYTDAEREHLRALAVEVRSYAGGGSKGWRKTDALLPSIKSNAEEVPSGS